MARKGETVHLRCEADGDQPMDVTWKAKGSRIESDYEMRYVTFFFVYKYSGMSYHHMTGFILLLCSLLQTNFT
jgi:Immunoglobulin I-set domain.